MKTTIRVRWITVVALLIFWPKLRISIPFSFPFSLVSFFHLLCVSLFPGFAVIVCCQRQLPCRNYVGGLLHYSCNSVWCHSFPHFLLPQSLKSAVTPFVCLPLLPRLLPLLSCVLPHELVIFFWYLLF